MQRPIARTRRFLLAVGVIAASVIALAGACKGDNEQRAPAPDTSAARTMDSAQVLAFLAAINQSEVQVAQSGTRRASDAEVRRFGQLLWREHAQSGRDVAELARQMEIDLRAVAPPERMIANLRAISQQTSQLLDRTPRGPGFDRAFLDSQVRAHQALVQDLRRIVSDSGRVAASLAPGGGVDVGITPSSNAAAGATAAARRLRDRSPETPQEAAQIMLARVQQHLDRARQIQSRLAGGTR